MSSAGPKPFTIFLASVVALVTMSTVRAASDDAATKLEALEQEIAQLRVANDKLMTLRDEVAQLRSDQEINWLNERRAEEVKSLVREVLADAQTRASLLDNGLAAGHNGKHFFLGSEDGSFMLEIAGQLQMRYLANFRENSSDDNDFGFEIRRAKLNLSGHIAEPKLTYEVQLSVSRRSNGVSVDKIAVGYKLMDGVKIWVGEDKAPFLREELTSSKRQLAVERSVFNEEFTLDKVQGVGVKIKAADTAKIHLMIHDGMRSADGPGVNPHTQESPASGGGDRGVDKRFFSDATDFAITARADFKLAGDWKQGKDFTAWSGEEFAAFLGAAFHYEVGETGDSFNNNNFFAWTIDGSIESNGFNVFGAVAGQHTDLQFETMASPDRDLLGFLIQGGYQIELGDEIVEPFVRYEWIDFDGAYGTTAAGRDSELSIVTFGANYYFKKHNAKLTCDVMIALDNVVNGHSGLGLRSDSANEDGQVVVRSQFQLLF